MTELARVMDQGTELVSLPYVHKHLGHCHLKKGEYEDAIKALRIAIQHKKDYRQAYDLLSDSLRAIGEVRGLDGDCCVFHFSMEG